MGHKKVIANNILSTGRGLSKRSLYPDLNVIKLNIMCLHPVHKKIAYIPYLVWIIYMLSYTVYKKAWYIYFFISFGNSFSSILIHPVKKCFHMSKL